MIYTLDLLPAAEAARTTLRIALLGPPMLMWGGQPVAMARRQARALLYRIAAAAQPVAREQLAFLLWPDSPEATARRNLTVLLTQIRRALPSPDLLVTVGDAIGLNCEAAETDTAALATLIVQVTGAGRLDLLANALLRYRGPFLDGFALPDSAEFDAWASQERQAWERRYLDALAVLVEGYAFEHLLSAAVPVADLVAAAPGLRILATSRSVLNLSGEQILPVPPLPLPDLERLPPPPELATQPAVALLLARARAHTPAFQLNATNAADLAAICVHLDGLPLAIELAAARLKALSPQALLKRLDHRLSVLDRGPRDLPDRQRTLRAAIEWSYRLLDLHLQRLFERLAAFAGGWTLEAAEAICGSWELGDGSWELEATASSISQLPSSILDGLLEEAQSWIAKVLRGEAAVPYPWRGRVRAYASYLAYRRGFPAEATDLARIAADDAQAVAEDRALALRVIGLAALQADDITSARPHFERALAFAQDHGLRVEVASAQFNLGLLLLQPGDPDGARLSGSQDAAPAADQLRGAAGHLYRRAEGKAKVAPAARHQPRKLCK